MVVSTASRRNVRRGITGLASLALLTSLAAAPASAAPPSEPGPGGAGSVVARGTLLGHNGAPADDSVVTLYAWPSADATRGQQVGDSIALEPVAESVTDGNGRYELRLPDPAALKRHADQSGVVNFEVIARADDGVATFDFPRRVETRGQGAQLFMLGVDLDQRPIPARAAEAIMRVDQAATITPDESNGVSAAVDKYCSVTLKADYGPRIAQVGQSYSTTTGVVHDFEYYSGASSQLGVGYSVGGSYGTYRQSGTAAYSSNTTLGFPAAGDYTGRHYRTQFAYGKYFYLCSYSDGSTDSYYKIRPYSFVASTSYVSATAPTASYCASQVAGATITKQSTAALTWSNGLDIDYHIGIDLSTQTGYTSSAKLTFKFNAARRLCGTHDYPGGTPRRLVAK